MNVKIRKAKTSDLNEVAIMQTSQNLIHNKFDHKIYSPVKNFEKKWVKLAKKKLNKNHLLLVAEDKKSIIGFIHGDIRGHSLRLINQHGHINDIYIKEDYRNKKIGAKLTNRLMEWFRSKRLSYVELSVSSKNKTAIKFYNKIGFREYEKVLKKDI